MNKRQTKKQYKKLAGLFQTVDAQGQLAPSFLLTPYSDVASRLGWCEWFTVDVLLCTKWQRLTPKGLAIRQRYARVT